MKHPIGVTFDPSMLRELDRHELAQTQSRSSIIRLAVAEFLRKKEMEKKQNEEGSREKK